MSYYRQYHPSALLAPFIECYWVFRSPCLFREERLIPGGRVEMIFNFGDPFRWLIDQETPQGDLISQVHLMGQRDRIFFGRPSGKIDMLGVRFKAGGLPAFTSVPVCGLLNRMVPAEQVLGAGVKEWEEPLYDKEKDADRIVLLDQLLRERVRDLSQEEQLLQAAAGSIRAKKEEVSIRAIADQAGWSYKRLERAFLRTVGYTPKSYHKIVRFNTAVRRMSSGKDRSLTEVCYECGYYDQAHFIKDFRRYTGTAPGHFQSEDNAIASFLIRHQPV